MRMGLPQQLVTNQMEVFRSQLGRELRRQLGIKRRLITLDHLQVLALSCTEAIHDYYCIISAGHIHTGELG